MATPPVQHSRVGSTASIASVATQTAEQPDSVPRGSLLKFQAVETVTAADVPAEKSSPTSEVTSPVAWGGSNKNGGGGDGTAGRVSQMTSRTTGSLFSSTSSWTFEIASMVTAAAAVAAIIAVLAYYDNKPLPAWPTGITLNALIAVLTTIATASMSVPLSSGLSQLKWIRFKTGRAPLADMEYFDDASRGALGALSLLFRARGGVAGSFGAFAMIVALLLSPFSQQIATYPMRTTEVEGGAATNLRALGYELRLPGFDELAAFVPILPIKSAVYYGLFAENNKPWLNLPLTCPTGNCTFGEIETFAICQSCVDMTEYMTRSCVGGTPADGNMTGCGWKLPSGAALNTSAEVFSMTSLFPGSISGASYSTIMKLIFMGTEAFEGPKDVLKPWAKQCTLNACVQRLNSVITHGELNETIVAEYTNTTVPNTRDAIDHLEPIYITSPVTGTQYNMSRSTVLAWQSWFAHLFQNGTASRNAEYINRTLETAPGSPNVLVNLTVGISEGNTFFDHDVVQAFYWNYYEYPTGIEMLVSDLAVSTTVSVRAVNNHNERVNGTTLVYETYVHVRWGFVAVPAVAVLLAVLFLALAANRSARAGAELWKSSALAMLFHGLDDSVRARFGDLDGLEAKKKEAKEVKVKLEGEEGGGVLRTDRVY
ncbi:hypothetical protein QBC47DRAFT_435543 [Echria macrotheca]|uniref:Uncharacterized protein n=1 Tax=Echria macrotheca TaxID=438768 RepID=A0AAJ0F192_9PEZI|nr:hypothetical protein QBC47DRAFT_435543 [Echria macrotheca]